MLALSPPSCLVDPNFLLQTISVFIDRGRELLTKSIVGSIINKTVQVVCLPVLTPRNFIRSKFRVFVSEGYDPCECFGVGFLIGLGAIVGVNEVRILGENLRASLEDCYEIFSEREIITCANDSWKELRIWMEGANVSDYAQGGAGDWLGKLGIKDVGKGVKPC